MTAMPRLRLAILLLMVVAGPVQGQPPITATAADSLLQELRGLMRRDPERAIERTTFVLEEVRTQPCLQALVHGIRSGALVAVGQLDHAMADAHWMLQMYHPECDSVVLLNGYSALASVHMELEEYAVADSLYSLSVSLWGPSHQPRTLWPSLLTGQAAARAHKGDLPGAEKIFRRILQQALIDGVHTEVNDAYINLGAINNLLGQLDSAIHYMKKALDHGREHGMHESMAINYTNLGATEHDDGRYHDALVHFDSALHYAQRFKDLKLQVTIHFAKAKSHAALGRFEEAYQNASTRYRLQDSLIGSEKVKALAEMQEKYESTRKEKEILGLQAQNLEGELERSHVRRTRNIYFFSGVLLLGAAGGLWGRLRIVHRSRKIIRQEKEISEGLLHNILPVEVANEIKMKGYADVREFPQASVLFTDFKGFTELSEKLSAADLVAEIDHCFKAFDRIMDRHGVEKIKTIGDAYMAVGGVPDPARGYPADVVRAALDLQEFMAAYGRERQAQGRLFFEMRIGVHTGPVIAGIVGLKKYAYDIWSDTVNTASRMESHGVVGQVNISEATYALVKDTATPTGAPMFQFEARGHVNVKGKGELEMFLVAKRVGGAMG